MIAVNILSQAVTISIALLLASTGEMFNQRAGIFNLGCEGIMAIGAFLGMLIPFAAGHGAVTPPLYNVLGLFFAAAAGMAAGLFFALVVVTFRASQGIAGIGLEMFGLGIAGSFFRHFIGGSQSVPGIGAVVIPFLSAIPFAGKLFFSYNIMVYIGFLCVPISWYVLFKTPWGLQVRACGTNPRAADSIGVNVSRIRYQALAVSGAMAGLAGAYLSLCQTKMFNDEMIAGRGFIAVALVYFGHWHPVKIMWGVLLFSLAQSFQYAVQGIGINFPYELAVMFPYILVIAVLAFSREESLLGPSALGTPFDREIRT